MHLHAKQLIGLPVRTRAGMALGKIAGFDVDTDSGRIVSFYIKTRGLVAGLLDQELIVGWGQVISVDAKEAVVQDGAISAGSRTLAAASESSNGVNFSLSRSESHQDAADA